MSHFVVLVVGENPEEQLAPFQENNMSDCPKEYLRFVDVEDERKKQYETDTTDEFYCSSSSSWGFEVDKEFYNKIKDAKINERIKYNYTKKGFHYFELDKKYNIYYTDEKNKRFPAFTNDGRNDKNEIWVEVTKIIQTTHPNENVCFDGIVELKRIKPPKELKVKDVYPTFEQYMEDYCGYKKDEVHGRYGYWENPNAKWDWYQLGGRWCGFFKLKHPNMKSVVGKSGTFGNKPEFDSDQALKSQIDFEGMVEAKKQEAKEDYELVEKIFGGKIPKIDIRWKDIIDDKNPKYKKMNIDEKRDFYHSQPALQKYEELRKKAWEKDNDMTEEIKRKIIWMDLDNYQYTKKEFVERAGNKTFVPFAVIKDGKWYERGSMGWWGCVSDEKDADEWSNQFTTLMNDLPGNTLLSIYDCHI